MRIAVALLVWLTSIPAIAAEMKIQRDVAYTSPADGQRRLDIYAPQTGDNHPIAIWIHGGGWRKGDKAVGARQKPQAFVDRGYVFVSINYRFVPDVTVQEMAGDIARAVKWVHTHADEHGGSSEMIFVMGHSAGAHLAALVSTDARYLKAQGLSLSNIAGCVPVDTAVYDIPSQVKEIGLLRRATYTSVFGKDEENQRELSPQTYVAKNHSIPPFLVLHVADRRDSTRQSNAFVQALRKADVQAKAVPAAGKTHGTINLDLGKSDDKPTAALFEFLAEVKQSRKRD